METFPRSHPETTFQVYKHFDYTGNRTPVAWTQIQSANLYTTDPHQILLEPLGKDVLGFSSDKAYSYFVNAKDTHKTFETLCVLLEGTSMEMVRLYVQENINCDYLLSANEFLNWCSRNSNETFSLVYQLLLNFTLAIFIQKVGVRANNWKMIDAGRMKFLPFFYGFKHPIYQEVEYRDLFNRASYPEAIATFLEKHSCFNASKLELNHQGGDFCLENKTKRHKMIAPKGKVSNTTWRTISRGLDEIEKIQENAESMLCIDTNDRYKDTNVYNEIVAWRAVLRSSRLPFKQKEPQDLQI